MSTGTLFGIGEDMVALHTLLCDVGGDVSDEDAEAAVDAWLVENAENLTDKLEGYRAVMKAMEASAAFRKAEAAVRMEAARRDEANIDRMKKRLQNFFETYGMDRVDLPSGGRFSLAKNGGKIPVNLLVDDASVLPERFRRVSYAADKDALREALESGESVPFATLGERGQSLLWK